MEYRGAPFAWVDYIIAMLNVLIITSPVDTILTYLSTILLISRRKRLLTDELVYEALKNFIILKR